MLGSCGAWPEAGRACSGFLLEYDGFRVLLDLGYAALPRLLAVCPDGAVDAVLVTHRHPDHCVDVSGLGRVVQDLAPHAVPLPLYAAPGVEDVLRAIEPRPDPATVFELRPLAGADVGPFRLDTFELPHHVPNLGVRLTAPGVTVAYTGDTGPSERLADLARDADLFVCEATLQGAPPRDRPRTLTTAAEAGEWAAKARARRLLLTHFWPGSDRAVSVAEAAAGFGGEILAAEEGLVVEL